jgi:predicted RNA binding protein YcfA (HicA-like mRNA interferase family)
MPRKLRQLRADLKKAGFVKDSKRGKGSHTYWEHPKIQGYAVTLSGHDGTTPTPIRIRMSAKPCNEFGT